MQPPLLFPSPSQGSFSFLSKSTPSLFEALLPTKVPKSQARLIPHFCKEVELILQETRLGRLHLFPPDNRLLGRCIFGSGG